MVEGMRYRNPIISGFHPDPSICRVGNEYYLVNSSFEYFPAIPIYHSYDLIHWEQIGHVLDRNSQVSLGNGAPNCLGIYAPTIRYHEGIFYCIVTNVGGNDKKHPNGNFFVWTKNPAGDWSEPVWLPFEGIDPSLFFDDDGCVYYSGTDTGIYIAQIHISFDEKSNQMSCDIIGEKKYVWEGSGGNNPEGPHIYKKDGMYYLMIAEGGTEYCHMVTIARSKDIEGPYESCPHNPILSNRSTGFPIKATGHADIVDDEKGNWWAVCLGIRPLGYPFLHNLGRETMLIPAEWKDGWLSMGINAHVEEEIETDLLTDKRDLLDKTRYQPGSIMEDYFKGNELHQSWNVIYNYDNALVDLTGDELILRGNNVRISDDEPKALICRRQEHFKFCASVVIEIPEMTEGSEAGLSVYMNARHHYEVVIRHCGGKRSLLLRRQIGSLIGEESKIDCELSEVTLLVKGNREYYEFFYLNENDEECSLGKGETAYLTTEAGGCFTGNYIAIFASDVNAHIKYFSYKI